MSTLQSRRHQSYLDMILYSIRVGDPQAAYVYARLSYRLALEYERANGWADLQDAKFGL